MVISVARKKVELRREEILDATVDQVQKRGIAAIRVTDVAAALGVSSGLVFYHFENKEQLVEEAFAQAARRDLDAVRVVCGRSVPAVTRLKSVLRLYGPTGKAPGWRLWIDGWSAGLREPGLRAVLRRMDQEYKATITQLIAEGASLGEFSCDDPDAAAWRITAFMDGVAVQIVARGDGPTRTQAAQWVRAHAAREVGLEPAALEGPAHH